MTTTNVRRKRITAIPAMKTPGHIGKENGHKTKRRVAAYARVSTEAEEQASSYEAQIDYNPRDLETQQAKLGERIEETITLMNQLITTAASSAHDPDDYDRRYHQLENRHHQLETEHQHITCQIDDLRHRRAQAIKVRDYLATQPPLEYSDQAWNTLVDHATVTVDGAIDIQFKA